MNTQEITQWMTLCKIEVIMIAIAVFMALLVVGTIVDALCRKRNALGSMELDRKTGELKRPE